MEFSNDGDGNSTHSMSDDATEAFLAGIGSRYILKMVEAQKVADESKHVDLLFRIQDLFMKQSRGMYSISPERTEINGSFEGPPPPSMPWSVAQGGAKLFFQMLDEQEDRMLSTYEEEILELIGQEFGRFFNKYSTDGDFQQRVLETKRPGITAASAWGWLVEEYPLLVDFIGGMATLFPGTATVEADFSTISLNKGTFRQSLSDLSLEGILHAKQIEEITLLDDIFAMMK